MKLTATSISTLSQKTKYQYYHCTGKIPRKLQLTEFPTSGHILWHDNKGVVFAKRKKNRKRPKCNNNAQKYTKNENFLTIFFIEGTLLSVSRRSTICICSTYILAKIRNIGLNMKVKKWLWKQFCCKCKIIWHNHFILKQQTKCAL